MPRSSLVVVALTVGAGCGKDDNGPSKKPSNDEAHAKLVGIYPDKWSCDLIATPDKVAELLGGAARAIDTPVLPPAGVPRPCNYLVGDQNIAWTFDLDCREGYKQRADALFVQYEQQSSEAVNQFNVASDARTEKPEKQDRPEKGAPDAAPPGRTPEAARPVPVGAKGLDHHGQGLLFIDDDAPCYVRVVGPDADRRLALAQHIVSALTLANAPMTPRAAP